MWRFGLAKKLRKIVGKDAVLEGGAILQRYPSLADKSRPQLVCLPQSPEEISQILEVGRTSKVPIALLRGKSSAGSYSKEAILIDLDRMNRILEIDAANLCAVVQPLASLSALSAELGALGLAVIASTSDAVTALDIAASAATGMQLLLLNGRTANIGGKPQDVLGYSLAPLIAASDTAFGIPTKIFLRLKRKNQLRANISGITKSEPSPAEAELLGRLSEILNPFSTGKFT